MTAQSFPDQLGSIVEVSIPVKRIISLVPSQTELLSDLGLDDEVVGVTKFCVHPEDWTKRKVIVGGTKNFNFEIIDSLKPELIIANKEENYKEGIELLSQKYAVWTSDITDLPSSIEMILAVGKITGRESKATQIANQIKQAFLQVQPKPSLSVLYLIWRKPWMAAGADTFIHSMIEQIGWRNAVSALRYPELGSEDISILKPEVILLSSEPYPFKEKHIAELKVISPSSKIILVDGEMFSWYGSRLLKAPAYFNSLQV